MASKRRRTYSSPLRAEQMDRTREKLIEAGVELLTQETDAEISVRTVAARAQVSVPTAYRHFADRDTLLDAMAHWIDDQISSSIPVPSSFDTASEWLRVIYANFDRNDRLMRAQLRTPAGQSLRARNQKARKPKLLEMTKRSLPSTSPDGRRRFTAILQLLANAPAWISLHDQWEMDGAEAGRVVSWAVETLFAEIRRHPTALDDPRATAP
ncbi:MAG: TetR/AcrR family transcriptional regulator [Polyangiales bacterium]